MPKISIAIDKTQSLVLEYQSLNIVNQSPACYAKINQSNLAYFLEI